MMINSLTVLIATIWALDIFLNIKIKKYKQKADE